MGGALEGGGGILMLHVDFKKDALSNLRITHVALSKFKSCHVPCHYVLGSLVACP